MIEYSTRAISLGVDRTDYRASFEAQGSALTTRSQSAFTNLVSPRRSSSRLTVAFTIGGAHDAADFSFQFAPDAGFGGALYLDDTLVDKDPSDLWWRKNWDELTENLQLHDLRSFSGRHRFDVYWAEECCACAQGARFSADGGQTYQARSVVNLDALNLPEPGTLLIVGLGLAALGASQRRRAARSDTGPARA